MRFPAAEDDPEKNDVCNHVAIFWCVCVYMYVCLPVFYLSIYVRLSVTLFCAVFGVRPTRSLNKSSVGLGSKANLLTVFSLVSLLPYIIVTTFIIVKKKIGEGAGAGLIQTSGCTVSGTNEPLHVHTISVSRLSRS